ncbi:hypothetical protein OE88DRAFT_1750778 [Heliocybe sulcata]|uniref:Helitron helicase-like domain-containing protein n=1 Tax=Heliocybe sulcata TaxID=5364 RepID=A0A5C3MYU5_9AGAM|nr:hypothetical protein OE88DRAFT_1750778 [Heliocybe sulcata]
MMVKLFIKHVSGIGSEQPGLYGNTSAYYGTVEQQGRLTLHLHLLLWITGSLSPQEIRNNMMEVNSEFRQKMIEYLEGVHQGHFIEKTMSEVENDVKYAESDPVYKNPTETLPDIPPEPCTHPNDPQCPKCDMSNKWWIKFKGITNDLLYRSNIHSCGDHCLVKGICKARFPRPIINKTVVDDNDGSILLQKLEERLNTFTPALTYLLCSNSDVTSLLSGTALKAVVAYVTDYITKTPLKTYTIFQTIRDITIQAIDSRVYTGNLM